MFEEYKQRTENFVSKHKFGLRNESETSSRMENEIDLTMSDSEDNLGASGSVCESAPLKHKSFIWKHYKLKADKDNVKKKIAVCTKCPNKSFAYTGGTSTLRNHLKRVHFIDEPKESMTQSQIESKTDDPDAVLPANPFARQVTIEDALARDNVQSILHLCSVSRPL